MKCIPRLVCFQRSRKRYAGLHVHTCAHSRDSHVPDELMYACVYVRTYVCMYVCTYTNTYFCTCVYIYLCMYGCMYVNTPMNEYE